MQIQIFRVAAGDPVGVEELNRFLRRHRVLSVDRHFAPVAFLESPGFTVSEVTLGLKKWLLVHPD